MYTANFKTDEAVYDQFKVVCLLKKEQIGNKLTELMRTYISENQNLIENPNVQQKLTPELPPFFGDQQKWLRYIRNTDKASFESVLARVQFLRYLLHKRATQNPTTKESEDMLKLLRSFEFFKNTTDFKFLVQKQIAQQVHELEPVF